MSIRNLKSKLKPVFKKGRFFNSNETHQGNLYEKLTLLYSLLHEAIIFFTSLFKKRIPENIKSWFKPCEIKNESSQFPSITWIGHATFLIQIGKINILTDPIFFNNTILFPRIFSPGIALEKLPKIDYVLISHNHWDHMDSKSLLLLKRMYPNIKFLVPFGDKQWFDNRGFLSSFEFYWWQQHTFENNIKFTFLPSHHWSQRGIFDYNKSLWGSWMIEKNGYTIYFAGDTAYSNHFIEIANQFPNIDISLMPIGPCEPREKMSHTHVSAQEAGQGFLELGAKHFIPMHWGTFNFGTDSFETPITRLNNWWKNNDNKLMGKTLNILKVGQRVEFTDLNAFLFQDISKQPTI